MSIVLRFLVFFFTAIILMAAATPAVFASKDRPPSVAILQPSICQNRFEPGDIQVSGTASGNSSQVLRVEISADLQPSQNVVRSQAATPSKDGDWSHWSTMLRINDAGTYRVMAHVVDKDGGENWDEKIIQVMSGNTLAAPPRPAGGHSVAVLEPMFTEAAYGPSSTELGNFYAFYFKYNSARPGTEIQTDLNSLNATIPPEADHQFSNPLVDSLSKFDPSMSVTRINDMDVHNGYIFDRNGSNLFDAIFLLHDEYVTVQEYQNYEKFVKNGGTIVPLDGNIFYAEVNYQPASCTVHFVRGHDWEFDGSGMHRGVSERFFDENKKFIGSNFIINDIHDQVTFSNNVFNYTHFEENYLDNQNASILIDYGANIPVSESTTENANPTTTPNIGSGSGLVPEDLLGRLLSGGSNGSDSSRKIATYELEPFGNQSGRVIMLGLFAQNLLHNDGFLRYLSNVIFPLAFGDSKTVTTDSQGHSYVVHFKTPPRYTVRDVSVNKTSNAIDIKVAPVDNYVAIVSNDTRFIGVFPKSLIDADGNGKNPGFLVKVDGSPISYSAASDNIQSGIAIDLASNGTQTATSALMSHNLSYAGTRVLPEFQAYIMQIAIAASLFATLLLFRKGKATSLT